MIICIEQGIRYTGGGGTGKSGIPRLVNSSSEINMLANSMQNRLGLRNTTILINCHCQTKVGNAVSRSNFNLAFRKILPKLTKIQNIEQGTKNGGKWKETRYQQVKQWLIILDRLPEGK